MQTRLLILAAALVTLLPAAARADCVYKPYVFFPEKNDGVLVDSVVDSGSTCTHRFAEGPGYKFTGIGIELAPEQGTLVKTGPAYIYTPKKGYTGKDAYAFQICANRGDQKGCSTIAFVVMVK